MNETRNKRISTGEDAQTEFKSSFSESVIETLVAFANTKGGTVYVGVGDNGQAVEGHYIEKETIPDWTNEVKNKTQPALVPDVEIITEGDKQIAALSIPEFPVKPVSCRGKYFKRVGNSNHQMTLSEIANLHLQTINLSWDFTPDSNHSVEDISIEKVNGFIEAVNKLREYPVTDDPLTVLHKYELLRNEQITIGCFLLFCKEDSLLTTIDAGRFDSETVIRDNLTIRSDLFSEVRTCMDFICKHISKRFVITDKPQRNEVWEYPLEAVREIVINMIVHRDYRASADSTIKIFDDRIEFFNPGGLPADLTIHDILSGKSPSVPRNKQIASMFKETGTIEKYGSGIKRVLQIMSEAGSPKPSFETFSGCFKVTLYPIKQGREGVNEGVNEGEPRLLHIIKAQPGKRAPFYADQLGKPVKTVERWLKELRDNSLITFDGPPKSGGYYPVSPDKSHHEL